MTAAQESGQRLLEAEEFVRRVLCCLPGARIDESKIKTIAKKVLESLPPRIKD